MILRFYARFPADVCHEGSWAQRMAWAEVVFNVLVIVWLGLERHEPRRFIEIDE